MSTPFEPSKYAILVVDDEVLNRDMLARRLERRGFFVMTAPGGPEALEAVRLAGCDLVVLDLMMPEMSGHDVLVELRKTRSFADLPIIMASARGDTEAITSCLEAGANDYVTKPLDFPVVMARIRTQLALKAAVDELRASEARFKLVAERSADVICLLSPEGAFRFASAAAKTVLGRSPADLIGTRIHDIVLAGDRALLPEQIAHLGETRSVRMIKGDLSHVWVEVHCEPIYGSRTGKVTDIQCTIRDISRYMAPPEPKRKPSPSMPPSMMDADVRRSLAPGVPAERVRSPSIPPEPERRRTPSIAPPEGDEPPVRRR